MLILVNVDHRLNFNIVLGRSGNTCAFGNESTDNTQISCDHSFTLATILTPLRRVHAISTRCRLRTISMAKVNACPFGHTGCGSHALAALVFCNGCTCSWCRDLLAHPFYSSTV